MSELITETLEPGSDFAPRSTRRGLSLA